MIPEFQHIKYALPSNSFVHTHFIFLHISRIEIFEICHISMLFPCHQIKCMLRRDGEVEKWWESESGGNGNGNEALRLMNEQQFLCAKAKCKCTEIAPNSQNWCNETAPIKQNDAIPRHSDFYHRCARPFHVQDDQSIAIRHIHCHLHIKAYRLEIGI